jgi:hypothetical protein
MHAVPLFVGRANNMRTALAVVLSLAAGSSAFAAERAPAPQAATPKCFPIEKLKADVKGATFTQLGVGQYHVAVGIYIGAPMTLEGVPPGDGAMLVQSKGHAFLIWTKGDKEACVTALNDGHNVSYGPLGLSPGALSALKAVKTAKGEPSLSSDDDSDDERKL